ncbi:hypothetical protein ACU19_01480 [Actinobaculum suis]|nr:hypothetical protein ACU19_01480 [Actinobaculum suis]
MLTGELVDHVADLEGFALVVTIKLEVQRPHLPRTRRWLRAGCWHGQAASLSSFARKDPQTLLAPQAAHHITATGKAGLSGFHPSAAIAPASVLTSEGDQPTAQSGVLIRARLLVAFAGVVVRRCGYPDDPAGKAHRITHR